MDPDCTCQQFQTKCSEKVFEDDQKCAKWITWTKNNSNVMRKEADTQREANKRQQSYRRELILKSIYLHSYLGLISQAWGSKS